MIKLIEIPIGANDVFSICQLISTKNSKLFYLDLSYFVTMPQI